MTIIGCGCVLPRLNVIQHSPPEIVKTMFHEAAKGKNYMNALDFATFLETVQGQKGLDEHQVVSLVTQTVLSAIDGFHFSISVQSMQLDLLGFSNYLVNAKLNPAISDTDVPTHDMTRPLSHYYIYASHNSYLTGNQLTSSSSIMPIVEALRSGCRVIELDCWEKQGQQCWSGTTGNGNDIVVLHGNTLTSAVPFKDCVMAIKENAFVASKYPVIITIENHMGAEMQKKAALVLREILGDILFYPTKDQRPPLQFESPEVLKGFIIVSDQPPSDTIEDQLAVDPNAARGLAADELDDARASTSDHTRHAQRLKKHIKRVHKKAIMRVANTAAGVLRKSLLVERIVVPETVEFQELIYLYCAKPSEMKTKHDGPLEGGDRAIMANLSEPQLQNFIARHPGSLIEYSKVNLGRVYPFGLRFDSSNADPMLAWSHGFQIAALNLQGRDRPVWLAKGFFQVNGHCGYVKKPDIFLPGFSLSHEEILNLPVKIILKVTILLGTNWHRNFDFFKNPDFYVKVAVHGVKNDASKRQTQVIYNCNEPHWEHEHFEFPLRVPEIAVLRLECWEWDMGNHDFVGQACLPVRELRYGIRSVALRSKSGAPRSSKLLCHFQSYAVSTHAPPPETPHPQPSQPSPPPAPEEAQPPSHAFEEPQSPSPPLALVEPRFPPPPPPAPEETQASSPASEEPLSPLPPPPAPEETQPSSLAYEEPLSSPSPLVPIEPHFPPPPPATLDETKSSFPAFEEPESLSSPLAPVEHQSPPSPLVPEEPQPLPSPPVSPRA